MLLIRTSENMEAFQKGKKQYLEDFPGCPTVKNLPFQAVDTVQEITASGELSQPTTPRETCTPQ